MVNAADSQTRASVLVAGAGGFIGGWLIRQLLQQGNHFIRAVDIKPQNEWYQIFSEVENQVFDLREPGHCRDAVSGIQDVFNLAADMGGMGYIESHKAQCMLSVLINTNLLRSAVEAGVERFFFSSSACVYSTEKQSNPNVIDLKEADAYPAMPEDGYGWEKLFSERMCRHFREDYGIATRIVRYHNVYGPHGTWDGGREKAPAAICRKVIQAKLSGSQEIEIWGDGMQTRSFTYIDDCIEGTLRIMDGSFVDPINLGSDRLVSINELVDIVERIASIKLRRRYKLDAPVGVQGRNSDNSLIRKTFGWAPSTRLEDGLEQTYRWIYDQIVSNRRLPRPR